MKFSVVHKCKYKTSIRSEVIDAASFFIFNFLNTAVFKNLLRIDSTTRERDFLTRACKQVFPL